jgi:hypothetical protein
VHSPIIHLNNDPEPQSLTPGREETLEIARLSPYPAGLGKRV